MSVPKIILPWPPVGMSPNGAHGHWSTKSKAAKSYKTECAGILRSKGVRPVEASSVDVTLTFCPPYLRRYDLDNALARAKQGLDAVAEAIGVDDSQWRSITLERGEKCRDGAIIIHITEAAA